MGSRNKHCFQKSFSNLESSKNYLSMNIFNWKTTQFAFPIAFRKLFWLYSMTLRDLNSNRDSTFNLKFPPIPSGMRDSICIDKSTFLVTFLINVFIKKNLMAEVFISIGFGENNNLKTCFCIERKDYGKK